MYLYLSYVEGNGPMRSMETVCHGRSGIGYLFELTLGWGRPLNLQHDSQDAAKFFSALSI